MRRRTPQGSITLPTETREELRAYRDEVIDGIGSADRDLVDVRSPEEFRGELAAPAHLPQEAAQRRGHIPGAVNVPWATAVAEDATFKPIDQLRELYGAKGVDGSDEVVAYCRIGERSSHTWFVLHELLGYENVRNYDGSWTEYGSLVGVPIEIGRGIARLTERVRCTRTLVGPAPEGMPDPHLAPPQVARGGDPFAALRDRSFRVPPAAQRVPPAARRRGRAERRVPRLVLQREGRARRAGPAPGELGDQLPWRRSDRARPQRARPHAPRSSTRPR